MNPRPATHVVRYRGPHGCDTFVTWSADDADERAAAWRAAGFTVEVEVIEQPAIQQVLAEQEVAA